MSIRKQTYSREELIAELREMDAQMIDVTDIFGQCAAMLDLDHQELAAIRHSVVETIGGSVEGRPTQTINYLQRLRQLVAIEKAAAALEKFMGEQTGYTSDWPIELTVDDEKTANELCHVFNELRSSLNPL